MLLRLICQMFSKLLGRIVLRARSDTSKEIEILVLRHQLAVLQRHTPRPRMSWTDRGPDRRPHPTAPRPRRLGLLVTPATILRGFDWGNVRQLEIVSRRLLAGMAAETPVLADAAVMADLDIDSTQRRSTATPRRSRVRAPKVGGYTVRLRGLNPLLAAVSTPTSAPVLAGTRCAAGPRTRRAAPGPLWPRRSPPPTRPGVGAKNPDMACDQRTRGQLSDPAVTAIARAA